MNKTTSLFTEKNETIREASVHKGLFYPLEIIVFMVLFGASYYLLMPAAGRAIVNAFKISSDNAGLRPHDGIHLPAHIFCEDDRNKHR
jgi:hypothetical protein